MPEIDLIITETTDLFTLRSTMGNHPEKKLLKMLAGTAAKSERKSKQGFIFLVPMNCSYETPNWQE